MQCPYLLARLLPWLGVCGPLLVGFHIFDFTSTALLWWWMMGTCPCPFCVGGPSAHASLLNTVEIHVAISIRIPFFRFRTSRSKQGSSTKFPQRVLAKFEGAERENSGKEGRKGTNVRSGPRASLQLSAFPVAWGERNHASVDLFLVAFSGRIRSEMIDSTE